MLVMRSSNIIQRRKHADTQQHREQKFNLGNSWPKTLKTTRFSARRSRETYAEVAPNAISAAAADLKYTMVFFLGCYREVEEDDKKGATSQ